MTSCITAPLQAITVNGADSLEFLNRLVISDLSQSNNALPFSGICNPKGRLIYTFWIFPSNENGFVLFTEPALADELLRFFSMRVFRSQVQLSFDTTWQLKLQTSTNDRPRAYPVRTDEKSLSQQEPPEGKHCQKNWNAYWLWLMHHHLPWIQPDTQGLFIPQHLSLHRRGIVSVDKGCYPGQEVIARLHFLGKNKKHLYLTRLPYGEAPPTLPPAGHDLSDCNDNAPLFTLASPAVTENAFSEKRLVFQVVGTHAPDCLVIGEQPMPVNTCRQAIVKNL